MDPRTAVLWRRRRRWIRFILFPLLVVALFLLGRRLGLQGDLEDLRIWVLGKGMWGVVFYVAAYALAALAAIPGLPFTMLAGALWGSFLGVAMAVLASWIAAGAAFLMARYLARDTISRWLSRRKAYSRLQRATEESGAMMVILTRLFPVIPFALLNFGFGLSRIRFGTYMVWTLLAMLPGTLFYVVGGDALAQILRGEGFQLRHLLILVGILALLAAAFPWAKRRIRKLRGSSGP